MLLKQLLEEEEEEKSSNKHKHIDWDRDKHSMTRYVKTTAKQIYKQKIQTKDTVCVVDINYRLYINTLYMHRGWVREEVTIVTCKVLHMITTHKNAYTLNIQCLATYLLACVKTYQRRARTLSQGLQHQTITKA